jgi:hypothetical protein
MLPGRSACNCSNTASTSGPARPRGSERAHLNDLPGPDGKPGQRVLPRPGYGGTERGVYAGRINIGGRVGRRFEQVREIFAQVIAGQSGTGAAFWPGVLIVIMAWV